ncbi:putative ribonuclease H-like domain-containing protein [Tanacetum coccineum]
MVKPVWNNTQKVNHQNFAKKTHPCAKNNMVPRVVLMKSGLVSINTVRQVNAAHSKTTVNAARPMSYLSKTAHSTVKRPINKNTSFKNSNINQRVNAVRGKNVNTSKAKAVVNAVKGNNFNVVKASACNPQIDLQDQGVIDSGCSRHMTGNMSYLTDYEEIDGGYVAFGGNPKGGKITGKCTIKTGNLDFENVYFVRELKFNLFSVSQMCDKKNSVLFNDTECIVLSPNFKLIDESQVLLRVPRKNNMYSVDLKNIVPKGGLTCLFAKATSDESKLWHRRLGHLNFKTMNKLVKGNLVRGLPSKLFESNQTYVACQKGKQHRASFVTDDTVGFYMGFLSSTMDETSGILKSFITGIENLVDFKVKVIRCDNGSEFKNRELNQFYEMNGILRQFSVARTPQQNGVAERRNITLIEAARTMLVDSKLPLNFQAEQLILFAMCKNRVLVNSHDDGSKPSSDGGKKIDEDLRKESKCNDQEKEDNVNSTNNVNAASTNKEELLQFKLQEVWTLVDLPNGKRAIGSKWVFRNKKDERGIMIRNKARLVAQGYTQEEGIDYDEVFAPVARIKAIRLFLAYASFKDFMVYQMDVKSAFLYEKIEEEVYVCQPPGFEDPNFPDRVYKVEKALYGLHQAPRAWYETLSTFAWIIDDIIFGSTKKKLCNAFEKLMHEKFQMKSMGELTFFLGLQVQQKKDGIFISQDKYVVEILNKFGFKEVKTASTPMETQKPLLKDEDGEEVDVHMYRSMIGSLMYFTSLRPDIMFAVYACARYQVNPKVLHLYAMKRIFSDYAGASLDRKSTTGGCQFLGCRLISWQCKKQTVVVNSTTEVEYVAASSCCGQFYLILRGKAKKSVRLIMEKLFGMELELILAKTINGEVQLHALVDGKNIIITESTVRRYLQLEDAEGVDCPYTPTIVTTLAIPATEDSLAVPE